MLPFWMVPAWSDAMGLTTLQIPSNQMAAGFNPILVFPC
jgi:hypothetical protein